MLTLARRLLRRIAAVVAGGARFVWAALRRIPRQWADAVVVLAAFGLAAGLVARRTEDTERTVALVVLGAGLVGLAFWKLPQWQAESAVQYEKTQRSHFDLTNEARKTLAELLGGLFLVVGLAVTWQQLANSRDEQALTRAGQEAAATNAAADRDAASTRSAAERDLAQQGQLTDRFTAAVEQLGSEELRVRLGGIYALERIARDSKDDVVAVMEVLTAFVRERAPWPLPPDLATPVPNGQGHVQPWTDVQAVLTVIERGRWAEPWLAEDGMPRSPAATPAQGTPLPIGLACFDLSRSNLRGVRFQGTPLLPLCLQGSNLVDANLYGATLTAADLTGADLGRADLTGAELTGAQLGKAQMRRAQLYGATLAGASLWDADLRDAILWQANLREATLINTDLRGADLAGADLKDAMLLGTDLRGANLQATQNLTRKQLSTANIDETTQLPPDLHLPATPAPPPTGSPTP